MKKFIPLLVVIFFFGCKDDIDDTIVVAPTENLEVEDFIYKVMNFAYYWQKDVPELADNKFTDDKEYTAFLQSFDGPVSLFEGLQYEQDRYSVLINDYKAFENNMKGISLSNGMNFGLVRFSQNSSDIFAYVQYVISGSDAEIKGIKRGDIFTDVNGNQLTTFNYRELLFSNAASYTIDLATINNNTITKTGISINMTNSQQTEQSVHLSKVIQNSGKKVGYVMYNSFVTSQDEDLRIAFANFAEEQIDELVVDLRYNRGGSVATAQLLGGLIAGQHANKVFGKLVFNEKLSSENQDVKITNSNINLGLSRVFFLTTQSSASASEMTINGLKPYLNVVQIGDKTEGKDVGSNPFYDYIDSNRTINPNHNYLVLPITFKYYNSEGVGDYSEGLLPNISIPENLTNLGVLGDAEEPLLKKALEYIRGQATGGTSTRYNRLHSSLVELQTEAGYTIYFPKD
ncbi:MAG: S41 family peptidase [Flavobacteriaceae bacterium]|jgi:carboxyl-terminal processing protease|nr:peptidase S41 [Flavobacteriaceae bacterium]|tara:strand:- start:9368 stop:10741 length:1374 start_codon:yes stop_codon:yes gene_type:complete